MKTTDGKMVQGDRILKTFLALVILSGCAQEKPLSQTEPSAETTAESVLLSEAEIAAIREAVEKCGGTLRLDDDGQPVEVNLAAERGSADKAGLRAALACTRLRRLRLRAAGLTEEELEGIASLAALEELFLQDVPIGDAFLEQSVAELSHLQRLTLRNTPNVTSTTAIASLPKLTHLALIDLPIAADALTALTHAKTLASLDLRMCGNITSGQLAILAELPGLKELKLGGYGIDNQSMSIVAEIPNLESLTIEDASIDAQGLAELTPIAAGLRVLSLARCSGVDDEGLELVEKLDGLQVLMLRDMPVTGEFLQYIAAPEQLETLALNQTFLMDEAFDAIKQCQHLKRLELAQSLLGAEAIERISKLANLEYLNLTECGVDAASLAPLEDLTNLKTLIVEGNPDVSDQAVRKILGVSDAD